MFKAILDRATALLRRMQEAGTNNRVVLLVSESPALQIAVRIAAIQGRWRVMFTRTAGSAVEIAWSNHIPVVLYDREIPTPEWRRALCRLLAAPEPPVVILLSSQVDGQLWRTVLDYGGFDVVQTPIRADNLRAVVNSAMALGESAEVPALAG